MVVENNVLTLLDGVGGDSAVYQKSFNSITSSQILCN